MKNFKFNIQLKLILTFEDGCSQLKLSQFTCSVLMLEGDFVFEFISFTEIEDGKTRNYSRSLLLN